MQLSSSSVLSRSESSESLGGAGSGSGSKDRMDATRVLSPALTPGRRPSSRARINSSPTFVGAVRVNRFPRPVKGHARGRRTFSSTRSGLVTLIVLAIGAIAVSAYAVALITTYTRRQHAAVGALTPGEVGFADGPHAAELVNAQHRDALLGLGAGERVIDLAASDDITAGAAAMEAKLAPLLLHAEAAAGLEAPQTGRSSARRRRAA